MTLFNGWLKKAWDITKIVALLGIIGTIANWYLVYANSQANLGAAVGTNTEDIRELKDDVKCQEKINADQDRIMIRLEEFYKLTAPASYGTASRRADSIITAREDSFNALPPDTIR